MAFRVAVIISGRGSNMLALAESQHHFEIVNVISNNSESTGIARATALGLKTTVHPRAAFENAKAQKKAIFDTVCNINPDLVALAGYMQIVEPDFVSRFFGRLINIHPSLLPQYPGLDTHERALAAKEKYHGCTVHYVDQFVDTGPLIAQAKIEVPQHCDSHRLADIVLEKEHLLYPWVINEIACGRINLHGRKVQYEQSTIKSASENNFILF